MIDKTIAYSYSPFFPPSPVSPAESRKTSRFTYNEKPRKPDWLVLLMSALFLLTLLILWLVEFPSLFR
ncbi:hypothetical protein [Spirosoma pollinicola]|uniref:hypothetical protein n=1 Tax=Spirosoma pollinicola TaxID=2057025 RepID=UPI0012FE13AE|nr:hypothetical protein [Spirosoma pollinicola]